MMTTIGETTWVQARQPSGLPRMVFLFLRLVAARLLFPVSIFSRFGLGRGDPIYARYALGPTNVAMD